MLLETLLRVHGHVECIVLERLNRFVVRVAVGGTVEKAYINNTGRLHDILVYGRLGYCLPGRGARTRYRLFAVKDRDGAALIDTRMQMEAFEKALEENMLPWLHGCRLISRNPRLGESVLDYLVECNGEEVYVELKSAVLRLGDAASYPDCPSLRGRRHIRELINHARTGGRALLVFVAALPEPRYFTPNREADPVIAQLVVEAIEAGVGVHAIALHYRPREKAVVLEKPDLPIRLSTPL